MRLVACSLSRRGSVAAAARVGLAGLGFLEIFGNQRLELASRVDSRKLAVRVNEEDAGDGVDAPARGEVAVPVVTLVVLRPADLVLGDEVLELIKSTLFLLLVETDTDELDALVLELG